MAERISSNPDFKVKKTAHKTEKVQIAALGAVATELVYHPTRIEQACKAEFWIKWNDGPTRSTDKLSAAAVAQILDRGTLNKAWSKPGFKDWFLNKDEFRIRAEYLALRAMDKFEELMDHSDKDDVQLKAAKELATLAGKYAPEKREIIVADAAIQKMDIPALRDFIRTHEDSIRLLLEGKE